MLDKISIVLHAMEVVMWGIVVWLTVKNRHK